MVADTVSTLLVLMSRPSIVHGYEDLFAVMDYGPCLEHQRRQHASHARRTEDCVPSAHNDVGEDAGCLTVSGIDDCCAPRSANASIFDVASPSIAGFPGIPFLSRRRLRFVGGPGSPYDAAYWSELDACTGPEYRGTSAPRDYKSALVQLKQARLQQSSKQPGRNVDVRGTGEMTTAEPHVGQIDNDADTYARKSESCGNVQLDPPTVEQDMWKDLHGVHHGPVATAYGTVSIMSSSTALVTLDGAVRVDIFGKGRLRLPRRPQQLTPPLPLRLLYGKARS
ncbi:hypothetical protein MTO96_008953 [Rhipicephalus appendiculatus]